MCVLEFQWTFLMYSIGQLAAEKTLPKTYFGKCCCMTYPFGRRQMWNAEAGASGTGHLCQWLNALLFSALQHTPTHTIGLNSGMK